MIRTVNLNDKTYEERMSEAISAIPIYTDEWTNYNPSDPGITILENLALFETLLQDSINDMPAAVKANLLKMAGFVPSKGKCAHLLVKANGLKEDITLPRGQSFMVYDIPFETIKPTKVLAGHIICAFTKYGDDIRYFEHMSNTSMHLNEKIFSDKPKEGMELYLMLDKLPDPGSELIMYANIKGDANRNPLDDKDRELFSTLNWEYYTKKGFEKIHVKDCTYGFVKSGEIRLRIGGEWASKYSIDGQEGYCIRITLASSSYDIPPEITNLEAFLFELTQMDTKSYNISAIKPSSIELLTSVEKNSFITVFVREEKGGSYRRYEPYFDKDKIEGRYYTITEDEDNKTTYHFSKAKFGYAPEKGRACIRVLIYNEEVMRQYQIGQVLGYDDQVFSLPFKYIVSDSFSIVARREDEKGEYIYDFVRPGKSEEGNLFYLLNDRDGEIIIKDAGDFIGADLFIAGCAVYSGDGGNIREGNTLTTTDPKLRNIKFTNPARGYGGAYPESLEKVRERFIADINQPYTAITEEDYEELAKSTSGLCISKTRAHYDTAESRVYVAVLPGGDGERYPVLSEDYIKRITERINERKLLTTKATVTKTVMMPVNVRATVYIKQHYEDCEAQIEGAIKKLLDYPRSDRKIGQKVRFDEVFRCIEELPCVEFVHSLSIKSSKASLSNEADMDITPVWNALAVPGHISIDTIAYNG